MKLCELTGVKAHYDKNFDEIDAMFGGKDSKFKSLGGGLFAKVYGHDTGDVYKFWVKDDAYEKYIDYCLKHQDNPFLPKFKSKIKNLTTFFKRPSSFPDKIRYIKMEALKPVEHTSNQMVPGTDTTYRALINMLLEIIDFNGTFDTVKQMIERMMRKHKVVADSYILLNKKIGFVEDLFDVLSDLTKHVGKINDLHEGNIMLRGDQLVLTDPFADIEQTKELTALWSAIGDNTFATKSGPSKSS